MKKIQHFPSYALTSKYTTCSVCWLLSVILYMLHVTIVSSLSLPQNWPTYSVGQLCMKLEVQTSNIFDQLDRYRYWPKTSWSTGVRIPFAHTHIHWICPIFCHCEREKKFQANDDTSKVWSFWFRVDFSFFFFTNGSYSAYGYTPSSTHILYFSHK